MATIHPSQKATVADRDRAKRIIVEIIRQAGGEFEKQTNLYKAFYRAHLRYADKNRGYLSKWPIVRMPRGPGIDHGDDLLTELVRDGLLRIETIDYGEVTGYRFVLTEKADALDVMTPEEIDAVVHGVECVANKTAAQVSEESHRDSRAWNAARDGEELYIYLDLVGDEEFRKRDQLLSRFGTLVEEAFGK